MYKLQVTAALLEAPPTSDACLISAEVARIAESMLSYAGYVATGSSSLPITVAVRRRGGEVQAMHLQAQSFANVGSHGVGAGGSGGIPQQQQQQRYELRGLQPLLLAAGALIGDTLFLSGAPDNNTLFGAALQARKDGVGLEGALGAVTPGLRTPAAGQHDHGAPYVGHEVMLSPTLLKDGHCSLPRATAEAMLRHAGALRDGEAASEACAAHVVLLAGPRAEAYRATITIYAPFQAR